MIIEQQFTVSYCYPVIFTRGAFEAVNGSLREVVARSGRSKNRILVVIDSEVARLTPSLARKIARYHEAHGDLMELAAPPLVLRGGEPCKDHPHEIESIQALVESHRLCRHSFILAIGGGALLDLAGYAAATPHRGVRLIRMPTTVLAQNDAGIGVKNAINAFGRKNFLGTFAPPFGVVNDFDFLSTLQPRDLRSGMAEAVKVALIRDRDFFDELYRRREALASFEARVMERMITRCAELHLKHIAGCGDPFESGSSRPLDFGHWSAHRLEEISGGEIRHGEAVAIGMALDALYSHEKGTLGDLDLGRILTLLEDIGFDLYHPALSSLDVERSLENFREHLGGELSIPLLAGIGRKIEAHAIEPALVRRCIAKLARPQPHPVPPSEEGTSLLLPAPERQGTRAPFAGEL